MFPAGRDTNFQTEDILSRGDRSHFFDSCSYS